MKLTNLILPILALISLTPGRIEAQGKDSTKYAQKIGYTALQIGKIGVGLGTCAMSTIPFGLRFKKSWIDQEIKKATKQVESIDWNQVEMAKKYVEIDERINQQNASKFVENTNKIHHLTQKAAIPSGLLLLTCGIITIKDGIENLIQIWCKKSSEH